MSKEITVKTEDFSDKKILKDALEEMGLKCNVSGTGDIVINRDNNGLGIRLWRDIKFSSNKIVMDDMDMYAKVSSDGVQFNLLDRIKQLYLKKKLSSSIMNFGCGSMNQNNLSDGTIEIQVVMM